MGYVGAQNHFRVGALLYNCVLLTFLLNLTQRNSSIRSYSVFAYVVANEKYFLNSYRKFFSLPPGTKPAPLEQAKLSLSTSAKARSKSKNKSAKVENSNVEGTRDEDQVMADASAGEEQTEKIVEKPPTKKRGRPPSETKPAKRTLIRPDPEEENKAGKENVGGASPEPKKKRGKLVEGKKAEEVPVPPKPETGPAKKKEDEMAVKAESPSEAESDAVKPRRRGKPKKEDEMAVKEEPPSEAESDVVKPKKRGRPKKDTVVSPSPVKAEDKPVKSTEEEKESPKVDVKEKKRSPSPARKPSKPTEEAKKKKVKAEKKENSKSDAKEKKKSPSPARKPSKGAAMKTKKPPTEDREASPNSESEVLSSEDESLKKPAITVAARKSVQAKLISKEHPYPDWPSGDPVPYAAICKSFGLIESTTKRLEKLQHTSLLLRQVLRLSPNELLLVVHLMCNKLAADFEGIELGIGESLLIKAIGESCGRPIDKIKADHNQIGDLGVVAQQSRSNQATLAFSKPKPLTVSGVHDTLLKIATTSGEKAQQKKVDFIKRLLANAAKEGDEAKYIVRALEGKMRLGLADKTIEVSLSQAVVTWEEEQLGKKPTLQQLQEGEEILKGVYRYVFSNCNIYHRLFTHIQP